MPRVFVTGMGTINPLGVGMKNAFKNLVKGDTATVSLPDSGITAGFKCLVGGKIPDECYTEEFHQEHKMQMNDSFYSISNAIFKEALADSGLNLESIKRKDRVGIIIANLGEALQNMTRLRQLRGGRLMTVTNFGITGAIALEHDLQGYQGINANGCAASMFSLGDSYRLIKDGYQDIVFTGGIDKNVGNFSHHILDAVSALNQVENDQPGTACRPFDKTRQGAVQADGGAILVFESEESAIRRGAKIYAEVKGYHTCSVADNIYKPNKLGLQKVLSNVIIQAGWHPSEVDMINGHATATKIGDPVEAEAIKSVLSTPYQSMLRDEKFEEYAMYDKSNLKNTVITAYKGHMGHLNLASGATETAFMLKAMQEMVIPGTANLKNPVDDELNFAKDHEVIEKETIDRIIKIAVGFGANNAAIALERVRL